MSFISCKGMDEFPNLTIFEGEKDGLHNQKSTHDPEYTPMQEDQLYPGAFPGVYPATDLCTTGQNC